MKKNSSNETLSVLDEYSRLYELCLRSNNIGLALQILKSVPHTTRIKHTGNTVRFIPKASKLAEGPAPTKSSNASPVSTKGDNSPNGILGVLIP